AADEALHLGVDDAGVGVGVRHTVDLRRGAAQVGDEVADLTRLGELTPGQLELVRRELAYDEPGAVEIGPPEERVGVCLEGLLRQRRAMAMVLERIGETGIAYDRTGSRDVPFLHAEQDVVLQRLAPSFDEQAVRVEPGAADTESRPAH